MHTIQTILVVLAVLAVFDLMVFPFLGREVHALRHRVRTHVYRGGRHFHARRRTAFLPKGHIHHRGKAHPVNDHWHEKHTAKWPHLRGHTHEDLREIQDELLDKSNRTPLSQDELDYLAAANKHFDVRTSINFLGGRDHQEFGFSGVDQVHGTWMHYACGCRLGFVHDEHKAAAGTLDKVHAHHPHTVCEAHAPHKHDLAALHERVVADSRKG